MTVLESIKNTTILVTNNKLDQLRMEEELLIMMVKSSKHSIKLKTIAFERIKNINRDQIKLLGGEL